MEAESGRIPAFVREGAFPFCKRSATGNLHGKNTGKNMVEFQSKCKFIKVNATYSGPMTYIREKQDCFICKTGLK